MKTSKLFFSLILVIFFYTTNVNAFFSKNELDACKDAYNWLQKKIDKGKNVAQYRAYQNTVANYYQLALQRRKGMERVGQKPEVDKNMVRLCEDMKINLD